MAEPAHPSTCVCYDCLPGGKREHRVRPWPAKASECSHPLGAAAKDTSQDPPVTRARTRLTIPTTGGGSIEQCRLCGAIVAQETPRILEEPTE